MFHPNCGQAVVASGWCRQIQCHESWIFNSAWKLWCSFHYNREFKLCICFSKRVVGQKHFTCMYSCFLPQEQARSPGSEETGRCVMLVLLLVWTLPMTSTWLFSYLSLISSAFCSQWDSVRQHTYCRLPQNQAWWRIMLVVPEEEEGQRRRQMCGCFWGVRRGKIAASIHS